MANREGELIAEQRNQLRQADGTDQVLTGKFQTLTVSLDHDRADSVATGLDPLDPSVKPDLTTHGTNFISQLVVELPRTVLMIDPSLIVGFGDLPTNAQQALEEIDEAEALNLLRREFF